MKLAPTLTWLMAAAIVAAAGCRQKPPKEVVVADEEATPEQTEALAALSPPWSAPDRAVLPNELLTHWLVEPGRATAHIRLLLPTRHLADDLRGTAATLVGETMGHALGRRLRRYNATADITHRPGRIEVAIHTPASNLELVLKATALAVARPIRREVEAMHTRMVDQSPTLTTEAKGYSLLIAEVMGQAAGVEQFDPARLVELDADTLIATWQQLTAPQHAAMLVHAGRPIDDPDIAKALDVFSKRWRTTSKPGALAEPTKPEKSIHRRLGISSEQPQSSGGLLLSDAQKPPAIWHLDLPEDDRRTKPALLLARVIPTPTAEDRSRLRLAQRVLQEQYDIRVTISGSQALCLIQIPIKKGRIPKLPWLPKPKDDKDKDESSDPRREYVLRSLEAVVLILERQQPVPRLYQAAELWLGARMVRASLTGEDWTDLWSQAIDLSTREKDIVGALAKDARAMLTTTPEQLVTWQTNWLNFKTGTPGWHWLAIGKKSEIRPLLRPLGAKLKTIEPAN